MWDHLHKLRTIEGFPPNKEPAVLIMSYSTLRFGPDFTPHCVCNRVALRARSFSLHRKFVITYACFINAELSLLGVAELQVGILSWANAGNVTALHRANY